MLFREVESKFKDHETQLEQKAKQIDLEVERARISNLTTLQQGSTTGDAELVDGRVGINGVIYENLGEAIREQLKSIDDSKVGKEDLFITNMLNPNTIAINKYVEYGVEKDYTGWNATGFIKIDNTKKYSLFIFKNGVKDYPKNVYMSEFKKDKTNVSGSGDRGKKLSEMTFTSDTEYIRVSTSNEYISSNAIIVQSEYEEYIQTLLKYGAIIDLKENRIFETENKISEAENKIGSVQALHYNNVLRSVCRLGYDVYSGNTPPQQSVISYKMAYDKGFRILLCDLRFSSDNVPVLHHDTTINTYALNNDGSTMSETVTIASTTYTNLLNYDYGFYKGVQYKGTKIMHLKDMLKLCKNLGCELYIEVKAMNDTQAKIACDLVKAYKMENVTSWSGTTPQMQYVIGNIPIARVSTMPQNIQDSTITGLNVLKTGKNKVFFFAWDTTVLTKELVDKLILNEIEFEMGTLDSEVDILNYFSKDDLYYYCTGISSNKLVAGKVILENEVTN